MNLRQGSQGPAVRRLKECLGVKSLSDVFDSTTKEALQRFQRSHDLDPDGVCGPKTWAVLALTSGTKYKPGSVCDLRGRHPKPRLYARERKWAQITGVLLHQTGCHMPVDPERWINLNAHIGLTSGGVIVIVNDPTDMIWHGQGASGQTIGLEISGNFCGVAGDPNTLWAGGGDASTLTKEQLTALPLLRDTINDMFSVVGESWRTIGAHRQFSKQRRADPGSEIWQKVAMPWIERLHLDVLDTPKGYAEAGRDIPKEWDSTKRENY